MINRLLQLYSELPTFKGKNRLGQILYNLAPEKKQIQQKMDRGFLMDLDTSDRIQRNMFITRHHEPETELIFETLIHQSKIFVDVGANIGYMSLLAKTLNPQLQVYAFEPLPRNVQTFKKNLALNKLKGVVIFEKCVSDQGGTLEFMIPPPEESGWGRIAYRELFSGEKLSRDVTTLDEFYSLTRAPVDFIKMDVEGFEMKVLEGAHTLLTDHHPTICFEANEPCLLDLGTSTEKIFDFLKQYGYEIFAVHKAPLLTQVTQPIPDYTLANYFAIARK